MSDVANPDAVPAAAERPAMVTDPAPMVSNASNGTPHATSGGTLQAADTAAELQGNVQGNV